MRSDWLCTLEHPGLPDELALRMGMRYVRGLRQEATQALMDERKRGLFVSIENLVERVPQLRKNELQTLAEIGALNSLGNDSVDNNTNKDACHSRGDVGTPRFLDSAKNASLRMTFTFDPHHQVHFLSTVAMRYGKWNGRCAGQDRCSKA